MKNTLSLISVTLTLTLFLFISCTSGGEEANVERETSETAVSAAGMLQHNVYFYLHEDVTQEEREQFEEGLTKLLAIEAIFKSEMGVPANTAERDVTDHSFGYSIFTWFETLDEYKVYDEHPDHLEFIDTYSHLWSDVKVYDTELLQ